MLNSSEILTQDIRHTLAMSDVMAEVAQRAINWAEEWWDNQEKVEVDIAKFRNMAHFQACNMYDGSEDCVIPDTYNCDDCDPTDYEAEVMITTFVLTAIQYIIQHAIVKEAE